MTTSPGSDEGQRVICFPLEERLAQKLATQPVSVSPGEQAQLISEVQERFKEVSPHVLAELLTEIRSRSPHSDLESTAPVIAPLNPGTAAERSPSAPGLPRADVASPVTDQDRIANAFHIWEAPLADDAGRLERTLLDAGPGASAHTVSVGGDGMPAVSYAINDGRHVRWVDAGTGELTGPPLDDGRVASIALDAAGVVLNPPETLLALGESTVRLPGLRPGPEVLRALERTSAAEGSAEAQLERGGPGQHHAAATSPIATDGSSDAARPAVAAAGDREPLRPVLPQAFFDAPMRVSPVPTMDVGDGLESGPESGPESRVVAWSPAMEALAGAALAKMLGDHPVPENGSFATLRDAFHDLPEAVRKAPVHAVAQKVAERFLGSYNGLPGGAPASGWSYPAGGSSAAGWNAAGWINVSGGSSATGNASGQRPSLLPLFDPAPRRDFHENAQRLYHRVDRIADLKNDPQFMSALDAFMQNVNQNIWGVTTSVNEEAIGDLFSKLHRIRGTEVAYKWYVDHQNLGNFAYERDQKAADSVHQGHVWSKLNVWKSARREGILLETTIGGYLFNELKALGYGPAMQVLWGQLSHDYVTGLRGTVTADILLGTTTDSVLTSTEWPILKQAIVDGKVTEVVFHVWDLKPETNQWKEIQLRHVHTQRTFDELPPMIKAGDNAQEIRFRQKVIDAHEAFFYQLDRIAKAKPPRAILQTHVHRASVDEWTTRYPAARNPHIGFVFTGNMIEKGLRKALTEELQALNLNVGAVMSLLRALALNTKTGTDLTAQGPATEPATEPAPAAPGEVITDAPLWRPAPAVTPGTGTDLPAAGHPPAVPNRQMSDRDRIELAKILIENTYHSRREALESALKQLGQARENKANGVAGKCEEAVALALVGIAETQFVAAQSSWLKIQPTP